MNKCMARKHNTIREQCCHESLQEQNDRPGRFAPGPGGCLILQTFPTAQPDLCALRPDVCATWLSPVSSREWAFPSLSVLASLGTRLLPLLLTVYSSVVHIVSLHSQFQFLFPFPIHFIVTGRSRPIPTVIWCPFRGHVGAGVWVRLPYSCRRAIRS